MNGKYDRAGRDGGTGEEGTGHHRDDTGSTHWRHGGTEDNVGSVSYGREGYDARSFRVDRPDGYRDTSRAFTGRGWSETGGSIPGAPKGQESYGNDYRRAPFSAGEGGEPGARPDTRSPDDGPRFRAPKGYVRSDDRIREEICDRLGHLERVDPSDVEVSVKEGDVTLSGTTGTRWEKHVIEDQTANVAGVKDVHNMIRVRRYEPAVMREGNTFVPMSARTPAAENVNGTKAKITS